MTDPTKLLAVIRGSFPDAEEVYTRGACFELYRILKEVFPTAEPYYDEVAGHVYTKINMYYYDITGRVQPPKGLVELRKRKDLMSKIHRWMPSALRARKP